MRVTSPCNTRVAKSFKIWTITYDSEATINNCNTIKTEDNIQQSNIDNSLIILVSFLSIPVQERVVEEDMF